MLAPPLLKLQALQFNSVVRFGLALILALTLSLGCGETETIEEDPDPAPDAGFSVPGASTQGIRPHTVDFANSSTDADTYVWEFGDGASSSEETPSHTYETAGVYTVCLTAVGPGGTTTSCVDNMITVQPIPVDTCSFTASPMAGTEPLTVGFTNLSVDAVSYKWDFGDDQTSTAVSPTHSYAPSGAAQSFTATLECTGEGGDTKNATPTTVTSAPKVDAGFDRSPIEGIETLSVTFTNTSKNADRYEWKFGDGGESAEENPTHPYNVRTGESTSIYTATMTAVGAGGDRDTVQNDIIVHRRAIAKITTEGLLEDYSPFTVGFSCKDSQEYVSCKWDFGDNSEDSESNDEVVSHEFLNPNAERTQYTVRLTVKGTFGDTDTAIVVVTAKDPKLRLLTLAADQTSGSGPLDVQFTSTVVGFPVSYVYDFGDDSDPYELEFDRRGTDDITLPDPPVHTYDQIGHFTVTITVTGYSGDELSETLEEQIFVHILDPSFEYQTANGPLGDPGWSNLSPDGGQPQWVLSQVGDQPSADLQMPTHEDQYALLNGAGTTDCNEPDPETDYRSTGTSADFHYPEGKPVMEVDFAFINVEDLGQTDFLDLMKITVSSGAEAVFIAGADVSDPYVGESLVSRGRVTPVQVASINLKKWFPDSDQETVFTLNVRLGNCGDSDSDWAPLAEIDDVRFSASLEGEAPLNADFEITNVLFPLPGEEVTFNNLSTGDGEGTTYFWDFGIAGETTCVDGDGNETPQGTGSNETDPVQCFPDPDTYDVTLTMRRGDLLESKITKPVVIGTPPEVDFSYTPMYGPAPLSVEFTNLSNGGSRGPLQSVTYRITCATGDDGASIDAGCVDPGNRVVTDAPFGLTEVFPRGKYNVEITVRPENGPAWDSEPEEGFEVLSQQGFTPLFATFPNCAQGGCHNDTTMAGGFPLTDEDDSYDVLTTWESSDPACIDDAEDPLYLVDAVVQPAVGFPYGDALNSVLYSKVNPDDKSLCGPSVAPHSMDFRGELEMMFDWIEDGAAEGGQ